jgi:uncharacterized protein DUF4407
MNHPPGYPSDLAEQAFRWVDTLRIDESDATQAEFADWASRSPKHVRTFLEEAAISAELDAIDPNREIDVDALVAQLRSERKAAHTAEGARAKEYDANDERPTEGRSSPASHSATPPSLQPGIALARRFFASLAGYDLSLASEYAGPELEHERKKLVRIGASVMVPAILAFFATSFFLSPYISSLWPKIAIALLVSLVILGIDCMIVTTLCRNSTLGTFARILISICMSIVVSEPVMLLLYQKTIDARIQKELDDKRTASEVRINRRLSAYESDYAQTSKMVTADASALALFSPANIGQMRMQDDLARQKQTNAARNSVISEHLTQLESQKRALEKALSEKRVQLQTTLDDLNKEGRGLGRSGVAGKGPIYASLNQSANQTWLEVTNIEAQLNDINQSIAVARKGMLTDPPLGREQPASAHSPGVIVLTASEQAQKSHLEDKIKDANELLATIKGQESALTTELAQLRDRYALTKYNDSLTQTRALYAILAENWVLRIKVITLFLLLFLIDLTPVLIKLTARTAYDDYLISQARLRAAIVESAVIQRHRTIAKAAEKKLADLSSYLKVCTREFGDDGTEGQNARALHSMRSRILGEVEHRTAIMLMETREATSYERPHTLLTVLLSGLKRLGWMVQTLYRGSLSQRAQLHTRGFRPSTRYTQPTRELQRKHPKRKQPLRRSTRIQSQSS